jgi:hypothetical protein
MGLNFYREDPRSPHMNLKLRPQPRRRSTRAGQVEPILLGEECSRFEVQYAVVAEGWTSGCGAGCALGARRRIKDRLERVEPASDRRVATDRRDQQIAGARALARDNRSRSEPEPDLSTINFSHPCCARFSVSVQGCMSTGALFRNGSVELCQHKYADFGRGAGGLYLHRMLSRERDGTAAPHHMLSRKRHGTAADTTCSLGSDTVRLPTPDALWKRRLSSFADETLGNGHSRLTFVPDGVPLLQRAAKPQVPGNAMDGVAAVRVRGAAAHA